MARSLPSTTLTWRGATHGSSRGYAAPPGARVLARRWPRVTLDPEPIYVHDRGVYTSAGSTASIDLVLGLVEEDFGRRVAHADPSGVGQVVAGLKLRFCG